MSKKLDREMAIHISGLRFAWRGDLPPVLNIENLRISQGERIFIEGASGVGKSTLLNLIAGVVIPQQGIIRVNGRHINAINGAARDRFRADHIGYIYQMFNLIPYLSVVENVTLPCRFSSRRRSRASRQLSGSYMEALRLLNHLGMDEATVLEKPVTELSVGQQQRVAAARALIGAPELLIADEPTSALDANRREAFIQLLLNECNRDDTTIIFVSHDRSLENFFDRTMQLSDINNVCDLETTQIAGS
jgi:putative ABC transport system ATP-binding protein